MFYYDSLKVVGNGVSITGRQSDPAGGRSDYSEISIGESGHVRALIKDLIELAERMDIRKLQEKRARAVQLRELIQKTQEELAEIDKFLDTKPKSVVLK